jgi:Ca2+-binding EF-hand superfamily protein
VISGEELQQLMSRMDMDGNGTLDFEELCTALLDWDQLHSSEQFGEAIDATFAQLDTGRKGYLEPADLAVLLPPSLIDADKHTREMEVRGLEKREAIALPLSALALLVEAPARGGESAVG